MEITVDGFVVRIDEEDFPLFQRYNWRVYASKKYLKWSTREKGMSKTIYFHRAIFCSGDEKVDHINGDSLDNRKCNLRLATTQQNNRNKSKHNDSHSRFKGIDFNKGKWRVRIRVDYKSIPIGRYVCEFEAAYNYDLASMKYHGEFGKRNFLPFA